MTRNKRMSSSDMSNRSIFVRHIFRGDRALYTRTFLRALSVYNIRDEVFDRVERTWSMLRASSSGHLRNRNCSRSVSMIRASKSFEFPRAPWRVRTSRVGSTVGEHFVVFHPRKRVQKPKYTTFKNEQQSQNDPVMQPFPWQIVSFVSLFSYHKGLKITRTERKTCLLR